MTTRDNRALSQSATNLNSSNTQEMNEMNDANNNTPKMNEMNDADNNTPKKTPKKRKTRGQNTMAGMVLWIEQNLLLQNRIRFNLLRDRLEINDNDLRTSPKTSPNPSKGGEEIAPMPQAAREMKEINEDCYSINGINGNSSINGINGEYGDGTDAHWRDLNERDLNEMTRQCCMELDIMVKPYELDAVLKSHLIPSIDPLKDYLAALEPYRPGKDGDWIQFVADMVRLTPTQTSPKTSPQTSPNPSIGGELGSCSHGSREMKEINEDSCSINGIDGNSSINGMNGEGETEEDRKLRERWNKCFRRWFLAMVESWRKDEVVNHQVLVLIGRQGIYKTTWLESLLPPCLRDYGTKFSGTFDKDDRLRIAESALINLDEIDAMTPRELNKMKALITAADINERKAFGHNKERRHRVASFCASGNRREFLSDTTGNRRWLSFEVEGIDNPLEFFRFVRYDRLYAQALYCLDTLHEKYWFDAEDIADIEEQNSNFRAMESEEELLGILFDIPADDACGEQVKMLTTAEISAKLVAYGNIHKPMPLNRLSAILRKMGFEQQRSGHSGIKRWRVYERTADEINLQRK